MLVEVIVAAAAGFAVGVLLTAKSRAIVEADARAFAADVAKVVKAAEALVIHTKATAGAATPTVGAAVPLSPVEPQTTNVA